MALALEILRMPLMELQAFLERQMEENPCLEVGEEESPMEGPEAPSEAAPTDGALPDREEEWMARWTEAEREDDEATDPLGHAVAARQSLHDTLLLQLGCHALSGEEQRLGVFLIQHIDEAGYLEGSLEELAAEAATTPEALERMLRLIQRFEPEGVGARSLQECLLLQAEAAYGAGSLAHRIVRDHFPIFLQGRLELLANVTQASLPDVRSACEQLRRLDSKPGTACSQDAAPTIVPDLIVHHRERHYDVELNDHALPHVTVSRMYARMLRSAQTPPEAREYLAAKARQAAWVMKALDERGATLLAIGRCLISLQREFLEDGSGALRPLTQAQVAALIGRHPSTVSRAIAGKTIATPYGVLFLEQFFASTVPQRDGAGVSDERVKAEIRRLVEEEDPRHALSDAALADRLAQRQITVARRTIAKYRTILRIPPAHLRRRRV